MRWSRMEVKEGDLRGSSLCRPERARGEDRQRGGCPSCGARFGTTTTGAAPHFGCERLPIDPFASLRGIFERISAHPMNRLEELLPDKWKAARHAAAS